LVPERSTESPSEELAPLVLIVEDYEDARQMYAEYLEFAGFRVAEARNGVEAIERTRQLRPNLVLMDLSLPAMDGWQATERLKADEQLRHIPIIALTAHALSEELERAKRAGCDGVIAKPCLPETLVHELRRILRESRRPRRTATAAVLEKTSGSRRDKRSDKQSP
jgi:CheY-like chemotaxis protein